MKVFDSCPNYTPARVKLCVLSGLTVALALVPEAIDTLANRYIQVGKRLHLRHLSPDCLEVLTNAKDMVELNLAEDPHYHIADNKLG